jgi:tetratricopeptide (TPR) repeat protein
MSITVSVQIREPTAQELRAQSLLKEATAKHDTKDLLGAIRCLREAYELLGTFSISYPVETYLRLPLYLQKAGLFQEAMESFNSILKSAVSQVARDFAHQDAVTQLSLVAMNRHAIYDKMRVACKREKRPKLVALYGLLSHASWCEGLHYQKRKAELCSSKTKTTWQTWIDKLFAPQEINGLREDALNQCLLFSELCTEEAFEAFAGKMTNILA